MKNRGFSLMEVLASMAIVGIALVAIMLAFSLGGREVVTRREELIALNVMRGKMEEIKCKKFSDVIDQSAVPCTELPSCLYQVVTVPAGPPLVTLKKVELSLQWLSADGSTQSRKLTTLVGDD
jgi:prepilin-type N-terminal cleavage/methylation domain-containing protein